MPPFSPLPRPSHLRQCLDQKRPLFCYKSNILDPMVIELVGSRGVGALWLDTEHFPTSLETMARLVQACRGVDTDALVRVPNSAYADASRALDLGANAILYPRVTTIDDVERLVRATKYPPLGHRGMDVGVVAAGYSGLSIEQARDHAERETILIVQIETAEAVEQVEAIAAVEGVDMLFIGPGDLSFVMDLTGERAEAYIDELTQRVARVCRERNIGWGIPARSLDHAKQLIDQGATLIAHGSDTSALGREVSRLVDAMAELGASR